MFGVGRRMVHVETACYCVRQSQVGSQMQPIQLGSLSCEVLGEKHRARTVELRVTDRSWTDHGSHGTSVLTTGSFSFLKKFAHFYRSLKRLQLTHPIRKAEIGVGRWSEGSQATSRSLIDTGLLRRPAPRRRAFLARPHHRTAANSTT